jgi:hypothetical protein
MKLRASYGTLGNDQIGNNMSLSLMVKVPMFDNALVMVLLPVKFQIQV